MAGRLAVLATAAALAAGAIASPLGATRDAQTKVPLRIKTIFEGNLFTSGTTSGEFTLDLGPASDAGKLTLKYSYGNSTRTAAGQTYKRAERTETLAGKQGTLVIHASGRQYPVGVQNAKDPDGDSEVWLGTWSIVRGTGKYAKLGGGGGGAGIVEVSGGGLSLDYFHRYEGFATS